MSSRELKVAELLNFSRSGRTSEQLAFSARYYVEYWELRSATPL